MITTATAHDAPAIDCLLDACFGPARRSRTAYRLREGAEPLPDLSLVFRDEGIAASIQLWPVALREPRGRVHMLTLLGPLAVSPARRCEGLGKALLTGALARADAAGTGPVVLIGDMPYYGAFGFEAGPTQRWTVPGPIDRARLLVRNGTHLPEIAALESIAERRLAA
ncbi:GNAT family N-acetyltransferase [Glacieibacterium frigidum]|uniref:N-acetyltransferase n=1 Tax=Glacieibacterium frigidum TaxID=2593303 RepID=A0A552UIV0_9SPHN|nr:N-acetyltransferase [Glacieibacterium frigidum]TRW18121.1 N-acetyltransferase [Glacieibacterium frigidum]